MTDPKAFYDHICAEVDRRCTPEVLELSTSQHMSGKSMIDVAIAEASVRSAIGESGAFEFGDLIEGAAAWPEIWEHLVTTNNATLRSFLQAAADSILREYAMDRIAHIRRLREAE